MGHPVVQCHIIHPIIPVEAHQALVLRHAVQLLLGVALVQDVDHALQLHHLGLQINKKQSFDQMHDLLTDVSQGDLPKT